MFWISLKQFPTEQIADFRAPQPICLSSLSASARTGLLITSEHDYAFIAAAAAARDGFMHVPAANTTSTPRV